MMPGNEQILVASLPTISRLALAYAPGPARLPTLALLGLDARLAGLLRHSREPMLAQLRLAWWRESLGRDQGEWPEGEPLLAALRSWNGEHKALTALVDGWEALTGPAPLPGEALAAMARGRGEAFAALARALGREAEAEAASRLGEQWGLADLAVRLGDPRERAEAAALAGAGKGPRPRLSRRLRPLLVLHALAHRRLDKGEEAAAFSPAALLKAMRLGLLGF
ncbi:phytoene synthase [Novosphingobium sp. CF614]|nr:phytoene synthase [Novosphingobium sp. CF614]